MYESFAHAWPPLGSMTQGISSPSLRIPCGKEAFIFLGCVVLQIGLFRFMLTVKLLTAT